MVIAFHGDAELRNKFVAEMRWHREQDMILQGATGEDCGEGWRGCCVACGVHSMARIDGKDYEAYDHNLWETLIGIPEWLARVCDDIFEGLTAEEAREFPLAFSAAVKCGADLDSIKPVFSIFLLEDVRANARDDGKAAIDQVISLWRRQAAGEQVPEVAWSAARSTARSAARSAAWSAGSAAFARYRDKLIELVANAE